MITHTDDKLVFQYVLAYADGDTTVTLEYDIKTQKASSPLTIVTPPRAIAGLTDNLFGKITATVDISTLSKSSVIPFETEKDFSSFTLPGDYSAAQIAEMQEVYNQLEAEKLSIVNGDAQAALAAWKTLLSDEVSIDIKDIGFTSYNG